MDERNQVNPSLHSINEPTESLNLLRYARLLRAHWLAVSVLVLLSVSSAFVWTRYFASRIYSSSATILPLKESGNNLLSSLRGSIPFGDALGLGVSLGMSDKDRLVTVLKSLALQESVAKDLKVVAFWIEHEKAKEFAQTSELDAPHVALWLAHANPTIVATTSDESPEEGILSMSEARLSGLIAAIPNLQDTSDESDLTEIRNAWHRTVSKAMQTYRDAISVQSNREGLITVNVRFRNDPVMAAAIANQLVQRLESYLRETTLSYARRQRAFLENRVQGVYRDLQTAEDALRQFKAGHSVISLPAQMEAFVTRAGEVQAELEKRKIALEALMSTGISPLNPKVNALRSEIAGMEKKLDEVEQSGGSFLNRFGVKQAPRVEQDLGELMRTKVVQETLYTLLMQEYEMAKIQEEKEQTSFQLLDSAQPPAWHVAPRLGMNLAFGMAVGLGLAMCYIAIRQPRAFESSSVGIEQSVAGS